MKNRRNTRRGRAKRWIRTYYGVWYLRGQSWGVDVQKTRRGAWECNAFALRGVRFSSRARALKSAEAVARFVWQALGDPLDHPGFWESSEH